jgi:hypothetical protein
LKVKPHATVRAVGERVSTGVRVGTDDVDGVVDGDGVDGTSEGALRTGVAVGAGVAAALAVGSAGEGEPAAGVSHDRAAKATSVISARTGGTLGRRASDVVSDGIPNAYGQPSS